MVADKLLWQLIKMIVLTVIVDSNLGIDLAIYNTSTPARKQVA